MRVSYRHCRMRRCSALVLGAYLVVTACGSADDEHGKSPAEKCEQLLALSCQRTDECGSSSYDECIETVTASIPCQKVTSVRDTFDACIDDLGSATCDLLYPDGGTTLDLPLNCLEVLHATQ
jgi:hypothetical protein